MMPPKKKPKVKFCWLADAGKTKPHREIAMFLRPGKKHAKNQFVAISDGQIVGLAAYGPRPFGNTLRGLVVADDYRKIGIGENLLHSANRARFIQRPYYHKIKFSASEIKGTKPSMTPIELFLWYEDRGARPKNTLTTTHVYYRHQYPGTGKSPETKAIGVVKKVIRNFKNSK